MDILDTIGININSPINSGTDAALSNAQFIISLIRNGLILLFAVVVVAAVIYAAISGLKFVRSEGASEKVEEAQESIKFTLIGVAAAFLGVIGVVVISAIFSPNTQAELGLRCAFGDFELCDVVPVDYDLSETCSEQLNSPVYSGNTQCVDDSDEVRYCLPDDANDSEVEDALGCDV